MQEMIIEIAENKEGVANIEKNMQIYMQNKIIVCKHKPIFE
jgi:hypothetical protein